MERKSCVALVLRWFGIVSLLVASSSSVAGTTRAIEFIARDFRTQQDDPLNYRSIGNPFGIFGLPQPAEIRGVVVFDTDATPLFGPVISNPGDPNWESWEVRLPYSSFTITLGPGVVLSGAKVNFGDSMLVRDGLGTLAKDNLWFASLSDQSIAGGITLDTMQIQLVGPRDTFSGLSVPSADTYNVLAASMPIDDEKLRIDMFDAQGNPHKLVAFQIVFIDAPTFGLSLSRSETPGCKTVSGVVELTSPAPVGGAVLRVSDTLASAIPPVAVKIAEGATSKKFTINTVPVAATEHGTVSVSLGAVSLSEPLSVRPMGLTSMALTPTSVVGSQPATGKATLECNAGPGPITVDLSSNNPVVASPVAASIVVPQGVKTANFDVTTNAVQARSYATISGTANGITKSKRLTVNVAAAASPTSLRFGNVTVGTTSGSLDATLTNGGAVPFSVNGISLTGTYASWFAQTSNCPANLAAGASCTITVRFTPLNAASKSAKLSIATTATSTPLSVSLSGTGTWTDGIAADEQGPGPELSWGGPL